MRERVIKRCKLPKGKSSLEERFALDCSALRLPKPEREYRFHPGRKWAFDFAFPLAMLAIECEGGHWVQGRHTRGSGFEKDLEKYNAAALAGWRVGRFTREMVFNGTAVLWAKKALEATR